MILISSSALLILSEASIPVVQHLLTYDGLALHKRPFTPLHYSVLAHKPSALKIGHLRAANLRVFVFDLFDNKDFIISSFFGLSPDCIPEVYCACY